MRGNKNSAVIGKEGEEIARKFIIKAATQMKEENPDKNYEVKEASYKKYGEELKSTNKNNVGSNPDFIVGRIVYEVKHWTK